MNTTGKRIDILTHFTFNPILLVECKNFSVVLYYAINMGRNYNTNFKRFLPAIQLWLYPIFTTVNPNLLLGHKRYTPEVNPPINPIIRIVKKKLWAVHVRFSVELCISDRIIELNILPDSVLVLLAVLIEYNISKTHSRLWIGEFIWS